MHADKYLGISNLFDKSRCDRAILGGVSVGLLLRLIEES